ncbi:hypothetical protein E3N88_37318 [Mikania micrantha]|uniref:Uncharacterized protein n=1 Tax=Mikania micrantha TaxID=192012 RepID=A0A5N6LQV9_9ASTR|nr:hypothetical protein E3N88_37318 [Mikania micrantha]
MEANIYKRITPYRTHQEFDGTKQLNPYPEPVQSPGLEVGFADQPFAPSWDVVNKDVFSNPVVASKVMKEFVPPGQRLISSSMEDEEMRNKVACLWAELGSLLPEMSQRWVSTSGA